MRGAVDGKFANPDTLRQPGCQLCYRFLAIGGDQIRQGGEYCGCGDTLGIETIIDSLFPGVENVAQRCVVRLLRFFSGGVFQEAYELFCAIVCIPDTVSRSHPSWRVGRTYHAAPGILPATADKVNGNADDAKQSRRRHGLANDCFGTLGQRQVTEPCDIAPLHIAHIARCAGNAFAPNPGEDNDCVVRIDRALGILLDDIDDSKIRSSSARIPVSSNSSRAAALLSDSPIDAPPRERPQPFIGSLPRRTIRTCPARHMQLLTPSTG